MPTKEEKADFAQRLRLALNRFAHRNAPAVKGATDLARQFNLRYSSATETGITPQTAHKWLTGQVIPKKDKITTLAEWLGVTEHWLHYGPPPQKVAVKNEQAEEIKYPLSPQTLVLIKKFGALSEHQRYLIEEMMMQFLGGSLE